MHQIPSTAQLRALADAIAVRGCQLREDLAVLESLVELTGIELADATRHGIQLELEDVSLALHAVALSVCEQRRSRPAHSDSSAA